MKREKGNIKSKVWIIGDSEPENCSDLLEYPFDTRHPTVHNIILSILYNIQDELFFTGCRIDMNKFYIRNAMKNKNDWADDKIFKKEVSDLKQLINENSPKMILTFGRNAFEFVRRSVGESSQVLGHWNTKKLGWEFARRCYEFDINQINVIPLLHASICRGQYLKVHEYFSKEINDKFGFTGNNYFEATAKVLCPIFLNNWDTFDVYKDLNIQNIESK